MIYIPPKDSEFCVMNVFNTDTGENLGHIDCVQDVNITSEVKTDYARDVLTNKPVLFIHREPTYTMNFNTDKPIDTEEFYKVLGIDASSLPDAYDIQFIKFIQSRKHKKRRINKKWLKRYGYKQIIVESKGWKMKTDTNGNVEFIK